MEKFITSLKTNKLFLVIIIVATFLRLWKISEIPVALFGDELDVGYHAYSILKTGRDYQGNFMPLHFHSLAEWRTPLYLYASVPTVALFGISALGVRLPAALFGILSIFGIYLLANKLFDKKRFSIGLVAAGIIAINPWHLQYSRAGFEVTMLLAFLIFGLHFFIKSLDDKGKWLWLSVLLLTFTPWIYSTAKLFTPLLFIFLFLTYRKEILLFSKSSLIKSVLVGLVVGVPIAVSTIFGGGSQRAAYTSVFTDPTLETEVGAARQFDAGVEGDIVVGNVPDVKSRLFHNKAEFWSSRITSNLLQAFSTDFLFIEGDPNLRHSPKGIGQFFKIEFLVLITGLIYFFRGKTDKNIKATVLFWLLAGVLPASLTRDGGNHATRLILVLPPLVFLMAHGLSIIVIKLKSYMKFVTILYFVIWLLSFGFYLHNYYSHYPIDSERWWHAGWKDAVDAIKENEESYDKVIISMKGEPAWMFFAANYSYDPFTWQNNYPLDKVAEIDDFGEVSHIAKYYFGHPQRNLGVYEWGQILDESTLYLANATEVGPNLIKEPERTPPDLNLVKAVSFPSGEPAFYLFAKK